MKKRIALLAIVATVLLFTLALAAFSVYTVNAATATTAAVNHSAAVSAPATTDNLILSDASSNTADSVEVSVQQLDHVCHGDAVDNPAY